MIVNDGKADSTEDFVVVTAETLNMVTLWTNRERTYNGGIVNEKVLAIDSNDNIYVSGDKAWSSVGVLGNYLRKNRSDGEIVWKTFIASPVGTDQFNGIYIYALAMDSSDNLCVAGWWHDAPYIGKLDSNVALLWTKQDPNVMGGPNALVIDSNDNFYVAEGVEFALNGNTHRGNKDIFITKFNSNGDWLWTRQYGTSEFDEAYALTLDSDDNIYVTGRTEGALDGNTNIKGSDLFVSKFTSDGTKLWTKQFGTISYDAAFAIGADSQNNIYISGRVNGSLDDNIYNGKADIFLSKYKSDGSRVWSRQFGTAEDDGTRGLDIGSNDNIYITGTMGASDFLNYRDGGYFVSRLNTNGDRLWTEYHEESGYGYRANAIGVDNNDEVCVARDIYNQDPDEEALNWYHYYEHFLVKYSEE